MFTLKNLRSANEYRLLRETIVKNTLGKRVFYAPNPGNWGDALINQGCLQFLADNNINYTPISYWRINRLHEDMNPIDFRMKDAVLLAGGGGAWCHNWKFSRENVLKAAEIFDTVIVFPTTYELNGVEKDNVIYFRRDNQISEKSIPNSLFCHDMAFYIDLQFIKNESGVTLGNFFRTDKERHENAAIVEGSIDLSAMGNEKTPIQNFFHILGLHDQIRTDRMHVAIAAAMMGKRVELYNGNYSKIEDLYKASIADNYPNVSMCSWL